MALIFRMLHYRKIPKKNFMRFVFFIFTILSASAVAEHEMGQVTQIDADKSDTRLTQEELEYLKNKKVLNTYIDSSWRPFSYHELGKPKGYYYDLQTLFAEKAGLELNVKEITYIEAIDALTTNQIDIMFDGGVEVIPGVQLSYSENSTLFYLEGILSKEKIDSFEKLVGKRIGYIEGLDVYWYFKDYKDRIEFIPFAQDADLYNALKQNKIDALTDNYHSILFELDRQLAGHNFKLNAIDVKDIDLHLTLAMVLQKNKILIDIYNKLITKDDIDGLQEKWGLKAGLVGPSVLVEPSVIALTKEEKQSLEKVESEYQRLNAEAQREQKQGIFQ